MSEEMKDARSGAEGMVPELRFPEFVGGSEWAEVPLGDFCDVITKGTTPTTLGFKYTDSGVNFIKIESIDNGVINLSKTAHVSDECHEALKRSQLLANDILFSIAGALGVVAPVSENELPANTNQALAIVRLKEEVNQDYIIKYLRSPSIEKEILKIKAGAAQPNISLTQVANFAILFPQPQEQQKIAACLSSLDELIAAHQEKLAALKEHKKGLMQHLFPPPSTSSGGETMPKVRFPEFFGDGEWVEKKLGEAAKFINGRAYKKEELLTKGKYRVLRVGNFFTNKEWYYSDLELDEDKYCDNGDLLYAWSASFGPYLWKEEKVIYHYHI